MTAASMEMQPHQFVHGFVFQLPNQKGFVAILANPGSGVEESEPFETGPEAYEALMDRAEARGLVQGGVLFIPPELQHAHQGEIVKGNPEE